MDDQRHTFKIRQVFDQWASGAVLAVACVVTSGCAGHRATLANTAVVGVSGGTYQVYFSATRLKDHSALVAGSALVPLGQTVRVNTALTAAAEDTPALPRFVATLSPGRASGTLQLITKTSIREIGRTKKGKLKLAKRDQGALLPMRVGETLNASPATDPVQIAVRVERR